MSSELVERIRDVASEISHRIPERQAQIIASKLTELGKSDDRTAIVAMVQDHQQRRLRFLRRCAQRDGYAPFILFNKQSYEAFLEYFGQWAIDFMLEYLKDPEQITPLWAAQFCCAVDLLDPEQLATAKDKYHFVTQSHEFQHHGKIDRKNFQEFMKSYRSLH